ncbi:unnamed protein product, partial [Ectocarpus fasciculatus]
TERVGNSAGVRSTCQTRDRDRDRRSRDPTHVRLCCDNLYNVLPCADPDTQRGEGNACRTHQRKRVAGFPPSPSSIGRSSTFCHFAPGGFGLGGRLGFLARSKGTQTSRETTYEHHQQSGRTEETQPNPKLEAQTGPRGPAPSSAKRNTQRVLARRPRKARASGSRRRSSKSQSSGSGSNSGCGGNSSAAILPAAALVQSSVHDQD